MAADAGGFAARFGRNLARAREAADLSQGAVGDLAELHRTAVGQLERGERIPRADTVVKLAGALLVGPEVLLAVLVWVPPEIGFGHFEDPQEGADDAPQPA